MNRSSPGHRVPPFGLHGISLFRASEESSGTAAFGTLKGMGNSFLLGRIGPPLSRPIAPRRASPQLGASPLHAARDMFGFLVRLILVPQIRFCSTYCMKTDLQILVESKTRTCHGRVASGRRSVGRRGGAGLGRTGRRRIGPPRRQPTLVPPRHRRQLSRPTPQKHEQRNPHVNGWGNKASGRPAVYPRNRERSSFLAADQCAVAYLSL